MADPDEPKTAVQSGWGAQCRASEELDYFTELALHETRRWIQLVTKKEFKYENDFRASLEDGILLCELLNGLRPGTIRKINRLPTPIAGLDNINVFLEACQTHFGLKDSQLFHPCDLEDLSTRAVSDSEDQLKAETQRRLRNVAITVFWLGKVSRKYNFHGPLLDLTAFTDLVSGGRGSALFSPPPTPSIPSASPSIENISHQWSLSGSTPTTPSLCSATPSIENVSVPLGNVEIAQEESTDSINCSSAYGSFRSEAKNSQSSDTCDDVGEVHQQNSAFASPQIRDDGSELCTSDRSVTSDYRDDHSVDSEDLSMPVRYGTSRQGTRPAGLEQPAKRHSDNDQCLLNTTSNNNNKLEANDDYNNFRFSGQRTPSQNSLDKMVKENDLLNSRLGVRKSTGGRPDALQFIKTSGVTTMAEKAKETVTLMKQQKEKKKVVEVTEEDWQSNLSDWKSKMRRKSSGSLQRAQESLEYETITREEETTTKRKSKTFKEMMEEREKRKSGSYHFYPVDDSEDLSFSDQKPKRPDTTSDEKLSLFGFQKVDEPQRITRTEHQGSSLGRTIFDSRTYDGGRQLGSLNRDDVTTGNSERRSTSVNDEEQTKEEIAAWALEDDDTNVKSTTTTKTSTKNKDLNVDSTGPKHQHQNATYSSKKQDNQSEVRVLPIHVEQPASSPKETNKQFASARNMFENASEPEMRNIPVRMATPPKKIGVVHERSQYSSELTDKDTVENRSTKQMFGVSKHENMPDSSCATKETDRKEEIQRLPVTKVEKPQKNYIEKVIKISQKPDNKKGFGFTIRGGKEYSSPIVVEKVVLGGAADVCELMPGDEIVSINGALVANHYQASVQLVISQAVKAGQIELCIRRSFDKGKMDLFDEEEFEMEQEFERERHQDRNKTEPSVDHSEKQVLPPWQTEQNQNSENRPANVEKLAPSREQFDFNTEKDIPLAREELVANKLYPSMKDSATDINEVTEDEVPEVPCPPGFGDPSPGEQSWSEIQLQHSESEQAVSKEEVNVDQDTADEPPPLPAAPPPAPNWDTFPGEPPSTAAPDLSFLDPSDLVPEVNETDAAEDNTDDLEQVGIIKTRMEQLRRKAEFLGQNYQETEEYKKLQELKRELEAKHEKEEWEKIERQNLLSASSLFSGKDQQPSEGKVTESTHVMVETTVRSTEVIPAASKPPTNQPANGSNKNDDDAVAKLESDELRRQSRLEELEAKRQEMSTSQSEPWSEEQMRSWKSMEILRSGNKLKEFDSAGNQAYDQEKFEQDQENMKREQEERMRRAEEIENEKKKMEEKLLEKELARQRELEEIKKKRDEERRLRQQREEKERKERERREEIEFRQRHQREEAERRKREEHEEMERRQKQLKQEAERRAEQARLETERRKKEKQNGEMKTHQLQLEAEKLAQQEAELKAKEAELRSLEAERMKQIEEEQRRREEELRRYEEEQRRKDEEERREEEAIRQKELELRRLEEKLRQEEEKLRQQREQLHHQQNQMMYKTDQVSVMHTSRDNIHKGDFEYVYQPEPPPPQPIEPEPRLQESRYPEHLYADHRLPESRSLEPSKSVITERTERFEVKPSSQVTPPITQRIIKREPLIPPKPSIKSELASWSRKDVLEVSRRPAAQVGYDDSYQSSPLQARRRQELQNNRKSWSPEVSSQDLSAKQQNGIYPQTRGGSMTREEVLSMNRRSFTRKEFPSPEREHSAHSKSPSPPHPVMTKKTLHSLGAAPKSRLMSSEQWIRNEPKDRPRRSEVIRSSIGSVSEHWLVEEAERRRLAEMRGQERLSYPNRQEQQLSEDSVNMDVLAPPQGYQLSRLSRSWQGSREQTPSRVSPSRSVGGWEGNRDQESPQRSQFSYSQKPVKMSTFRAPPVPVHVTEVDKPEDYEKPQRPIPEDIKQSLIDRVNTPRGSYSPHQGPSSPVYAHPQVTVSSPSYPYVQSSPSSHHTPIPQSPVEHSPEHYPTYSHGAGYPEYSGVPGQGYPNQPSYQFGSTGQHHAFPQSHCSPEPSLNTNSPRQFTHSPRRSARPTQSPPKPPHSPSGPYGIAQPSWPRVGSSSSVPAGYQDRPSSSSGSTQSTDRAPPVPPKPPRLLSSSSEESSEQVVSVSASKRCSHCELPLGAGAVMVIESLNLAYHLACFRCHVCQWPLGSGRTGTDVRVRVSKLHCANCYSNDEGISTRSVSSLSDAS